MRLRESVFALGGLYRDVEGRWVVGDCDGPGAYRVEGPCVVEADGREVGQEGRFEDYVLAVRTGEGETRCRVVLDRREEEPPGSEWRQIQTLSVDDAEGLRQVGWTVQNASQTELLESTFGDGTPLSAPHACHLNRASWTVSLPAGCLGLRLRRLYDRFHGRQRARVLIGGVMVGWWYEPGEDRQGRWAWSEFEIGSGVLGGEAEVKVEIDPPAGTPLWSWSKYEVSALMARPGDCGTNPLG